MSEFAMAHPFIFGATVWLSLSAVAGIVKSVALIVRGHPPTPAAAGGDPLEEFKRSVSGMPGKERAEVTRRAREWMFSGVSK